MSKLRLPPRYFCWTKFGTEAGQSVEQILQRKEQERQRNHGVFMWGVGNSLGAAVHELVGRSSSPDILFSPIRGTSRPCDSDPDAVVAWRSAETIHGEHFALPRWSLVTSRQDRHRPKLAHYALVCHSTASLEPITDAPALDFAYLRNLISGHRLGASQVTAVVEHGDDPIGPHRPYPVAFRAKLVAPFFVRLRNPVIIPAHKSAVSDWGDAVMAYWLQASSRRRALG